MELAEKFRDAFEPYDFSLQKVERTTVHTFFLIFLNKMLVYQMCWGQVFSILIFRSSKNVTQHLKATFTVVINHIFRIKKPLYFIQKPLLRVFSCSNPSMICSYTLLTKGNPSTLSYVRADSRKREKHVRKVACEKLFSLTLKEK